MKSLSRGAHSCPVIVSLALSPTAPRAPPEAGVCFASVCSESLRRCRARKSLITERKEGRRKESVCCDDFGVVRVNTPVTGTARIPLLAPSSAKKHEPETSSPLLAATADGGQWYLSPGARAGWPHGAAPAEPSAGCAELHYIGNIIYTIDNI